MKSPVQKVIVFTFSLVSACVVLTGCISIGLHFVPFGVIDFPCDNVHPRPTRHCSEVSLKPCPERATDAKIEVFLDFYQVQHGGAGCHYEHSDTDILQLETQPFHFKLESKDNALLVKGERLEVGESYEAVSFLHPNPWIEYRIKLVNYGPDCDAAEPRIVVSGSYGTKISIIKGLLITGVLFVLLALSLRLLRKKNC